MGKSGPGESWVTRAPLELAPLSALHEVPGSALVILSFIFWPKPLIVPSIIGAFSLCYSLCFFFFLQSLSFFFNLILTSTLIHPGPTRPHNTLSYMPILSYFFVKISPKGNLTGLTRSLYIFELCDFKSLWPIYNASWSSDLAHMLGEEQEGRVM